MYSMSLHTVDIMLIALKFKKLRFILNEAVEVVSCRYNMSVHTHPGSHAQSHTLSDTPSQLFSKLAELVES